MWRRGKLVSVCLICGHGLCTLMFQLISCNPLEQMFSCAYSVVRVAIRCIFHSVYRLHGMCYQCLPSPTAPFCAKSWVTVLLVWKLHCFHNDTPAFRWGTVWDSGSCLRKEGTVIGECAGQLSWVHWGWRGGGAGAWALPVQVMCLYVTASPCMALTLCMVIMCQNSVSFFPFIFNC